MRKWEVPALIPIICSLLLCACMPNIESKSSDPVEADKEADNSADQKIKKQKDKKQKDNKSEMADYDGTWYEQMPGGGILTVEDGMMTYERDTLTDETGFTTKKSDNGYAILPDSGMFYFYEMEYVTADDEIRTYTQPMLDGDGGYKPSIFLRSVYVPGDEATIQYL